MVAGLRIFAAAVAAMGGSIAAAEAAFAQSADPALLRQIEELRAREAKSQERIESLERRLLELESRIGLSPGAVALDDPASAAVRGRGSPGGPGAVQGSYVGGQVAAIAVQDQGGGSAAGSETQVAEPLRKAPAPTEAVEAVTKAEQGFFGDRLSFEAGITYSHFDDARLNLSGFLALDSIFLGLISIDESSADILVADLTARYGLTNRLQFDVNVPYFIRRSNFQSGGAGGNASGLVEANVSDHGIGDVSFGSSYRLFAETAGRPDIVGHLRVKAPTGRDAFGVELVEVAGSQGNLQVPESLSTGTGVWSVATGVSLLKTLDPLVAFGSLTYFHNFEKNFDDVDEAAGDQPGRVRLGNAYQWGAGVAFALNEQSSLSLSFTQRFVERTRIRLAAADSFRPIVGSQANVGIFNVGGTFSLRPGLSLLTNLGIGMTTDAPDMTLSLRVPFSPSR